MVRPSCKELLLDAAETVVVRDGGARMTLDAVALEAGVSKGGLLYHFPSKEELLQALVLRHMERIQKRREDAIQKCDRNDSCGLRAELHAVLTRTETDMRVGSALLAVVSNDPKLLGPIMEFHRERFGRLAGEGFAEQAIVLLAADGLFFLDMLNLAPFNDAERKAINDGLLRMANTLTEDIVSDDARKE